MEDLGYKGYNIKIFFLLILAIRISAFALVVNTNEKTTAATVLMSIFFALKFFVVITLII